MFKPHQQKQQQKFPGQLAVFGTGFLDLLLEVFPKSLSFLALCWFGCTCNHIMQTIMKFVLVLPIRIRFLPFSSNLCLS